MNIFKAIQYLIMAIIKFEEQNLIFCYSIVSRMTPDEIKILDKYVEEIHKSKMLNEIQKLMFDRAHFARFLAGNEFDVQKAMTHFNEYLQWRK